jgi:hypothetical protein
MTSVMLAPRLHLFQNGMPNFPYHATQVHLQKCRAPWLNCDALMTRQQPVRGCNDAGLCGGICWAANLLRHKHKDRSLRAQRPRLPLGEAGKHSCPAVHCGSASARTRGDQPRYPRSSIADIARRISGSRRLGSLSGLKRQIIVSRRGALRKLNDLLDRGPIWPDLPAPNPADGNARLADASRYGVIVKIVEGHVIGQVHEAQCTPCVQCPSSTLYARCHFP